MKSLWMDTGHLPYFPPLWGEAKADVLVIGAGMAGILCAWTLQQAGLSCVVAEAATIASGATGGTSAKITAQHGLIYHTLLQTQGKARAKGYLEANRMGLEALSALAASLDCDFQREDHIVYSLTDSTVLQRELSALEMLGYPAELVTGLPLPMPTAGGIRFPNQARFHPIQFLNAIAQDLTIFENTPVRRLSGTTAFTDHGRIQAKYVIAATHFPFLRLAGGYFLKQYQQRSYVIALKGAPKLEGMYLGAQPNSLSFRMQGDFLLLGGGGHRTGQQGGGWAELERFAGTHYPHAEITHRWAVQDCMSLDQMPYIGPYSHRMPGVYVATGFNKWGMTTAMAAARILRDQILGRENPYAQLFSPSRHMPPSRAMANAGEAAKDFFALSPKRCPHLGCALRWNPQEHSWDCPCHGSRFSEAGKLLDNPAPRSRKEFR